MTRADWMFGAVTVVALFLWHAAGRADPPVGVDPEGARNRECEYGVTLALTGHVAAAESVFLSLLSHSPGDPRALANLGNLHLLRGEIDVALAFYDRAVAGDSTDAGIRLNRSTALLLVGEDDLAVEQAREGVRRAGGAREAAALLGIRYESPEEAPSRAAKEAFIDRDEMLALLRAASDVVPADSVRVPSAGTTVGAPPKPKRRAPTWRSAGARSSEGREDAATLVYWKR